MNVGGPSRHVVHLVDGLDAYGYETRLVVGSPESAEGSMLRLAAEKQIQPHIVVGLDRPVALLRDFAAFQQIVREIRLFKPHVVHTHTAKAGILGRLAAVLCGVPVIFHTFHGHVFSGYFSPLLSQLIVGLERFLVGFSDRLITLTPGLKEDISQRFKLTESQKIEVVPLGLDLRKNLFISRKSTNWRARFGLDQDVFLAGIVARLVPVKNHAMLIKTVADLVVQIPELHLAVVGGGELEGSLRALASSLGVADRIHFCGIVNEIEEVYADLDLLVLSSKNEGTPVVLIEALASGCPVAATRVGGIPEVLNEGRFGCLLSTDPAIFTRELGELVRSGSSRLSVPTEIRKKMAETYSVDTLVKRIDLLYRKTLKLRGIDV